MCLGPRWTTQGIKTRRKECLLAYLIVSGLRLTTIPGLEVKVDAKPYRLLRRERGEENLSGKSEPKACLGIRNATLSIAIYGLMMVSTRNSIK